MPTPQLMQENRTKNPAYGKINLLIFLSLSDKDESNI